MMKKLLLASTVLVVPAVAHAQAVPPDIKAIYGPTGYIGAPATYASGTTQNVLGDGSDAKGGTPPAFATMPADPNPSYPPDTTNLLTGTFNTPGNPPTNDFCLVDVENHGPGAGTLCTEPKFRTHAMDNFVAYDDAIRNYGVPGAAHCHTFFGAVTAAPGYATYKTLRAHAKSTAAGGGHNGTLYWRPCMTTSAQPGYVIKADFIIIYYNSVTSSIALRDQRIPRAHRYIAGFNMDDPDDSLVKKEIAAANAQPGTSPTRYSYRSNGVVGYRCNGGGNAADGGFVTSLRTGAGTDGFVAKYGAACLASSIQITVSFPECWNGKDLWQPDGYKHMRSVITDSEAPGDHLVCPNGWYRLPQLQEIIQFTSSGPSDYMNWSLSSDAMAQTKLNSLPACTANYSNAPCHEGASARTIGPTESIHIDWIGAWKESTFVTWQTNCLGLLGGTPHQCEPSAISATKGLSYDLDDGTLVRTTNTYGTSDTSKMFHIGSAPHHGPATVSHTSSGDGMAMFDGGSFGGGGASASFAPAAKDAQALANAEPIRFSLKAGAP